MLPKKISICKISEKVFTLNLPQMKAAGKSERSFSFRAKQFAGFTKDEEHLKKGSYDASASRAVQMKLAQKE